MICSGRMPKITSLPTNAASFALSCGSGSTTQPLSSQILTPMSLPDCTTVAGMKFIGGEPMKPATNRLAGLL
ncbi:hypothetical protein D3C72_2159570 [compost metagenome]